MKGSEDNGKVCKVVAVKRCCNAKVVKQKDVLNKNVVLNDVKSTNKTIMGPLKGTKSWSSSKDIMSSDMLDDDIEKMFTESGGGEGENILELANIDKVLQKSFGVPGSKEEAMLKVDQCTKDKNDKEWEDEHAWKSKGVIPPPPPPPPPGPIFNAPKQYTSDCPDPNYFQNECFLNSMGRGVRPDRTATQPGNLGHDPRGFRRGFDGSTMPTEADWEASRWDGIPFMNGQWRTLPINAANKLLVRNWLAPVGLPMIRGLHDLYYSQSPPPYLDKFRPTTAEIDAWNIIVINHIRKLLGEPVMLIGYDATLMLEVKWANEMRLSTKWDAKYGNQCPDVNPPSHCGATFQPDAGDRLIDMACSPYNLDYVKYPELKDYDKFTATQPKNRGTGDGAGSTSPRVPWSMRMGAIMGSLIADEMYAGHPSPYLTRRWVGMHWGCKQGGQIDGFGVGVRTQWI